MKNNVQTNSTERIFYKFLPVSRTSSPIQNLSAGAELLASIELNETLATDIL